MIAMQITISDFKAHCAEKIREVETSQVTLKLTRHGKVIAKTISPNTAAEPKKTVANLIECLKNFPTTLKGADFDEPIFFIGRVGKSHGQ